MRRWLRALLCALVPTSALAQQVPAQPFGLTPGHGTALVSDAEAVRLNPANLPLLPSYELRATYVRTPSGAAREGESLSVGAATPLVFDIAAGARVDVAWPTVGRSARALTLALGYQASQSFSLGASSMHTYSRDPAFDGQWGVSAMASWRMMPQLATSFGVRNLNGYENSAGMPLERSFEAALALRPTGKRALELGLEARYGEVSGAFSPRATLEADLPRIGRLRTELAIDDAFATRLAYQATAGVELSMGKLGAGAGAVLATGANRPGAYGTLSLRGYSEPGVRAGAHWVKVRIEATPGSSGHVRLLRSLWRLAESPEVEGVALVLKAEPADSFAHADELGDAVRMLRSRGKKVFCHLEDAAGRSLMVCSQADRTVINPVGGVRFAGLRSQYTYFGDLLAKLGVRAEFVRIGSHKAAAEQFAANGPTPVTDADHREMLHALEERFVHVVGGGRKISAPELKDRLARGPFVAREAREAGLVDGYAYDDEIDAVAHEMSGERLPVVELARSPVFAPRVLPVAGEQDHVSVVHVDGNMVDGRSRNIPVLGIKIAGSYTVAAALKQAREDKRSKAVVLRVESPGGSSLAADVMWREVLLTSKVKPVVVSMGGSAASGGYYIAAPGTVIFASPSTITGSIGIYYGKVDLEELSKKVGVNVVTYRTAPRADAESIFRPFTDDERQELGRKVKRFYDDFVDRVATGRKMTPAQVDAVARGKVYTGQQALSHHLVDRIGGLREALDEARKLGHLPADAPFVELPEAPRDLLSTVLSLAGLASADSGDAPEKGAPPAGSPVPLPPDLVRLGQALAPYLIYDGGTALARSEFELVPP